jgi:exosome complex RNA-binding protein Rrp42 (RNase PH superfamily)
LELSKPLTLLSRPISLTYGTFETETARSLLADPNAFEEPLLGASVNVIVDEKGVVGSVLQEGIGIGMEGGEDTEMDGGMSSSTRMVEKCIQGAKERRLDLLRVLKI